MATDPDRHYRDHYVPADPGAFKRSDPPSGRVIVIAPTRAACETIEMATQLQIDTVLSQQHGDELLSLAASGQGFGIMAGTGTGKTLAVRPIAETILGAPLRVGVVNREREATAETSSWNVVIVTTGIARRWFQNDLIQPQDTIVVDEIHQTSAELELCLALGKRVGCRFVWLSATVDPSFYQDYLESAAVLESSAFDPALSATVSTLQKKTFEFFDHRFLKRIMAEKRGVGVFLPTRAEVEELADVIGRRRARLPCAFYHGGEPISVIKPFLDGDIEPPFLLAMTAAGQSALNIRGLDTVVIYDAHYRNKIDRGRNVLTRTYLGPNEILQMAGRVHGRVPNGRVWILSDRDLEFESLAPVPPEFQLAGDSERVALTAAALGLDLRSLELPVPLDQIAYAKARTLLQDRGIIEGDRLTEYGKDVEAMPVDRAWAEMLVRAPDALVPYVAVMANIDSLHRMTRDEYDLRGLVINRSDHLTSFNVYAEAVNLHGHLGQVHGLPRHLFDEGLAEWADARGVLIKAIEDVALGVASVYRTLELQLPAEFSVADEKVHRRFRDFLAEVMPMDLAIDEELASGDRVRVGRNSTAHPYGAVAGSLRYFADRRGIARAAIEGTNLPLNTIKRVARLSAPSVRHVVRRKRSALIVERRREYFGFELDRSERPLDEPFPEDLAEAARGELARALEEGETDHVDQRRVERDVRAAFELWRRSGGTLNELRPDRIRSHLVDQLSTVTSWETFLDTRLSFSLADQVPQESIDALMELPSSAPIRGDRSPLEYVIEDGVGVVRLRLREGQARRLRSSDIPPVDRPLRFVVTRGRRGRDILARDIDHLREVMAALPNRDERRGRGRFRKFRPR